MQIGVFWELWGQKSKWGNYARRTGRGHGNTHFRSEISRNDTFFKKWRKVKFFENSGPVCVCASGEKSVQTKFVKSGYK